MGMSSSNPPPASILPQGNLEALLGTFLRYMTAKNLSGNTILSYVYGVKTFFSRYPELDQNNVSLYKVYLMERYRPQTVNMRIRALNCFLKSQDIHDYPLRPPPAKILHRPRHQPGGL